MTISTCAALHLFGGLGCVAAIGEQARRAAGDGERGAGAGESAEIADVGKMRNEQAGQARRGSAAAQLRRYGGSGPRVLFYHGRAGITQAQRQGSMGR